MAIDTSTDEVRRFTTDFLWMCQGYYRHAEGYTPEWPGMERFQGPIVHPQTWPEDLDYRDKEVIVIGSGATTATLVPAIAPATKHVTVIQRSPTYFWTGQNRNELADTLRELDVNETWIHEIVRRKILHDQEAITRHVVRAARAAARGADRRDQALPSRGLPGRGALRSPLSAVAAASRLRARRRPLRGHQGRQGHDGDRRDRNVHRARRPTRERA